MSITARLQGALDETRVGRRLGRVVNSARRHVVPTHWTGVFGIMTAACVALLFGTGIVLMFFYVPSSERVEYDGGYLPLHGAEMSRALASTIGLSLDVPGGLIIRQTHHWAALLLPVAIIGQLLVTFFSGGFRRPRQWAWVLLFLSLIAGLAAGWSGYALPDDMLSGTGLRIVEGIVLGIPIAGTWIANLMFGGEFPGRIIENLYVVHVLVPVALVALIVARVRSLGKHESQRMPGPARSLPPARVFLAVTAALWIIGATVTVSPIWLYGRADPGNVSAGSQPDWYTGFLDGALRLVPPGWEIEVGGYTVTLAVLAPLAVVGLFLAAVLAYPFVENWVTRDRPARDILDRPRDVPTRTAIGVAGMAFYGVLWGAASADVLATAFRLSLEGVLITFQVLLLVAPCVAFGVTQRVCLGLQRRDRELLLHGYETGRIVRMPGGRYVEMHAPLDAEARARLHQAGYAPMVLRPDAHGRISPRERVRALLSRMLFRTRIAPVTGSITTAHDHDGERSEAA